MNKTLKHSLTDAKTKLKNICDWLSEKKARELVALDLAGQSDLAEGVIVAGATSLRHGQGLADFVLEKAREYNYEFLSMEGYQNGQWILLDLNDVLLNIFQAEQRELYRLEELYPDAAVMRDDRAK